MIPAVIYAAFAVLDAILAVANLAKGNLGWFVVTLVCAVWMAYLAVNSARKAE